MDDDSLLIPVDVSGEEDGLPTSFEELVEKVLQWESIDQCTLRLHTAFT